MNQYSPRINDKDNQNPVINDNYESLTPDTVLRAIESLGLITNARILALNSYENRVYQIGIEDGPSVIAKFYRPQRWSDAAILEEHDFANELADLEIPVIAPLKFAGNTLHLFSGFRFTVFPQKCGRWPDIDNPDNLFRIGRFIGRIHAVGATNPFTHRSTLSIKTYAEEPTSFLDTHNFVPKDIREAYFSVTDLLIKKIQSITNNFDNYTQLRIYGDCHPGNILWSDEGAHFVDLDDCLTGPAVQDIWMLLSGSRGDMTSQLSEILDGYSEFHDFHPKELQLIESLRTLRMIHYSGWLAKRWNDPAFPYNFPWFNSQKYWEEQVLLLKEQLFSLDEDPLFWR